MEASVNVASIPLLLLLLLVKAIGRIMMMLLVVLPLRPAEAGRWWITHRT
jgi:hypothetical protein